MEDVQGRPLVARKKLAAWGKICDARRNGSDQWSETVKQQIKGEEMGVKQSIKEEKWE